MQGEGEADDRTMKAIDRVVESGPLAVAILLRRFAMIVDVKGNTDGVEARRRVRREHRPPAHRVHLSDVEAGTPTG